MLFNLFKFSFRKSLDACRPYEYSVYYKVFLDVAYNLRLSYHLLKKIQLTPHISRFSHREKNQLKKNEMLSIII